MEAEMTRRWGLPRPTGNSTRPFRETARGRGIPDRIGPYRVESEAGRGGMGIVYVARDTRLDRRVAIKMLPENLADDPRALAWLEHEAKLLASLNHPGIATIHSLENVDGFRFFTLEWIDGESLEELVHDVDLSVAARLDLLRQVAAALCLSHRNGIVHCDLKPANILVSQRDTAKILDFGIGRALDHGCSGDLRHATAGTPGYMSPELLSGHDPDERADTWAFGCLMYEVLTGRKAFPGTTLDEVMDSTLHDEVDLDALPSALPGSVRQLLLHCLEKNPADRLADMSEASSVLEPASISMRWQQADGALARVLARTLAEDEKAPHFELENASGDAISSQSLLAKGPLVLNFFRGNWCPVCVEELSSYERRLGEIAALGASMVAISPQLQHHNLRIGQAQGLGYHLLSDPGNEVAEAFGVAFELPADLRSFHRMLGLDLKRFNGDDSWILPIPATFVVSQDGTIHYAATSPDPTVRTDPDRAVEALRRAAREAS